MVFMYILYTLLMVPILVRCLKDLEANEAIPFEDGFLPRTVIFIKRKKNAKK